MNIRKLTLAAAAVCSALSLYLLGGDPAPQPIATAVPVAAVTSSSPVEKASATDAKAPSATTTVAVSDPAAKIVDAQPADSQTSEAAADSSDNGANVANASTEASTALAYDPPFPNRSNLFQAPKRQGKGRLSGDGQQESAIELLGFVNVYGPEVVLSIDGLATTIAEGGQHAGIEVLRIKPPSVFLQRGKQTWQASLEN